jgi:hypothetical protein
MIFHGALETLKDAEQFQLKSMCNYRNKKGGFKSSEATDMQSICWNFQVNAGGSISKVRILISFSINRHRGLY